MKSRSTGKETAIRWGLSGLILILSLTVLGGFSPPQAAQ